MFGILSRSPLFALFALCAGAPCAADEPHLKRLGVPAWHAKGITGNAIKVAILDSGFRGYRSHLGKALPCSIETQSFREDGNFEAKDSIHGLLCAEVVHAIAPDAKLLFANWEPDEPRSFLKAVAWARQQGAQVISCSIVMPGWSDGLGGGDVHRELTKHLDGALFFAAAGNLAQRHWTGVFRDDGNSRHLWNSERTENAVIPWGGEPVSIELVARDSSTYRLIALDDAGKPVAAEQQLGASGVRGSAIRFAPEPGKRYRVKVELVSGTGGEFRLLVLGGNLEISTPTGCMVFPGDGKDVIAVGAVSSRNERLPVSSIGHTGKIVKPDCVAPAPVPSRLRIDPFDGSSAAAPQAAGMAALLWSRDLKATASTLRTRMQLCCQDIAAPGPDAETGFGVIRLLSP